MPLDDLRGCEFRVTENRQKRARIVELTRIAPGTANQPRRANGPDRKSPTRRAIAKQQTRERVLAAARQLFSEAGYEGATIRDIAAAAGMSTGAVFANFNDKSDLFREIMIADLEVQLTAMRSAMARAHAVEDAIFAFFRAGYDFYAGQLPLARAAFSVSWTPHEGPVLRNAPAIQAIIALIVEHLEAGAARGELDAGSDLKLRAEMLYQTYLANYPLAIFEGLSPAALDEKSRAQIHVILAGARAR